MSLRCDTTEEMEFQIKPRLDAMKWAFAKLKEKSDNLGFYILGLSLTISCIESIKLVLEMGDNNRAYVEACRDDFQPSCF